MRNLWKKTDHWVVLNTLNIVIEIIKLMLSVKSSYNGENMNWKTLQERFDILYFSCLKCQSETFKTPVKYRVNVGQESYNISQKSSLVFRGISSRYFVMSFPQTCEESAVGKTFSEKNLEIEHLPNHLQYLPSFCDVSNLFLLGLSHLSFKFLGFIWLSVNLIKFKLWVQGTSEKDRREVPVQSL